jgi:hypothetical protein
VFDIKPYHPADCLPARRVPPWLAALPEFGSSLRRVTLAPRAARQLETLFQATSPAAAAAAAVVSGGSGGGGAAGGTKQKKARPPKPPPPPLDFYPTLEEARAAVLEVVGLDPRTVHSKEKGHRVFGLALDRLDVCFRVLPGGGEERKSGDGEGEVAEVFHLVHYARGADRPRLRTQAWHAAMLAILADDERGGPSS